MNALEWTTHPGLMYQTDAGWGEVYARTDWAWSDNYCTRFPAAANLLTCPATPFTGILCA